MSFWGIEVKPGKPFTHSFDRARGRLRISQATLGVGSSTNKSLVQCNIGDKSPVFLCSLLPDKTESCHLDLEFEEVVEVIFSVIGPRSVHLTGYYVGNRQHSILNDDSESYGEDIANTETEESTKGSDEDKYEDSFIDDGDQEVFQSSPICNDRVVDDEILHNKKSKNRKGNRKRLQKKYRSVESDDDDSSFQQNAINGFKYVPGPESDGEDNLPISSPSKSRATAMNVTLKMEEKAVKVTGDICNKIENDGTCTESGDAGAGVIKSEKKDDASFINGEQKRACDLPLNSLPHIPEVGPETCTKPNKKRKERSKEKKTQVDFVNCSDTLKEDKANQHETEGYNLDHEVARNNHELNSVTDRIIDSSYNSSLPSDELGSENQPKPTRRRKELADGKSLEDSGVSNFSYVLSGHLAQQDETKVGKEDLPARVEQDQKQSDDKTNNIDSDQLTCGDQSEEKKIKKKKKKSKTLEEGHVNVDVPLLSTEEKSKSNIEIEEKEANSSQERTLSNGLIIRALEMGKPDGKVAAIGKKVKVHYIGKLRENEQVFDSNIGKAPYKFRLGAEEVIEGWNVGLDGMRVGEKRRLVIPPSLGYGSIGAGENIPPNSWLVYDVKLLGVR